MVFQFISVLLLDSYGMGIHRRVGVGSTEMSKSFQSLEVYLSGNVKVQDPVGEGHFSFRLFTHLTEGSCPCP
jgi:hypothetical protein